ncbi:TPA: hypothetical protein DCR49_08430 [Candidatus Delongbacteria bacterium]|nr:hypothetical protein [Candidatus Delongbacteria bacterium]
MKSAYVLATVIVFVSMVTGEVNRGFKTSYQKISSEEMQIGFTTDYNISVVEKNGVKYSKISGAGSIVTNDKGYAELPYHAAAVQLKDDKNVTMKYSATDYTDIVLEYPMLPSRGVISRSQNIDEIPYEIEKRSVKNEWYPGKISEVTEPFVMRDVRGTNIIVYPYQYNAVTKTLRIYKSVMVDLKDNDEPAINALTVKPAKVAQEMNGIYKSIFLNYNETKALSIGELGEILVIYTSANGGLTTLQPWIDWKRQKGYKVNLLEKTDGTDLYVTQDIKNQYLANTNILYAQIVGDYPNLKSQVLNSITSTTGAQDPMLGCTVGTDKYTEVVVGRFSVSSSTELTNQIDKAINYEKTPTMAAVWYEKGIGIASNEGDGAGDDGEGDQAHSEIIINNKLLPFTYASVSTAYQANSETKATILGFVNDGRSLINYTGHGNYDCFQSIYGGYLYDTDVATLTNGTKLPFVVSVACLVGNIEYTTKPCFAEAWMRKVNGGAVGGWFSTISQPWLPPMRGQDYFNDILKGGYDYTTQPGDGTNITEQRTTVGTICFNAGNLMLLEAPTDVSTQDTQETWTIFGDVALQLRTDPPKAIVNNNLSVIPDGSYSTTITSGGNPVVGAWVTLYQNGTNYSAYTNSSGDVTVNHGFTAGDIFVTVTGFNLQTLQNTLPFDDSGLSSPKTLSASAQQLNVVLNWTAPSTKALSNYKVYRNSVNIATLSSTILTYSDINRPEGTYEYYITAVYTGDPAGESYPSNKVNVTVVQFPVPLNFTAEIGNDWDTAALTWSAPFKALTGYDVYKNGAFLATTTNAYYNDTNLNEGTYSYYVKAKYSEPGTSAATSTLQVVINEPLFPSATSLGFENGGVLPLEWVNEGNWTFVTTATKPTAPAEGSYFAYFNTTTGTIKKIITPKFDLHEYENVTLTFKYVVTQATSGPTRPYDILKVYYKDATTKADWVQLGSTYQGAYSTWQTASLPIDNAVLSKDFYIAFEGSDNGASGVSVDDIVVNGTYVGGPVVPGIPSNVITSVSGTDVIVTWDAAADATSYDVYASNDPYGTFAFVTNVPTNQYTTSYTETKKFWYIVSKNATK